MTLYSAFDASVPPVHPYPGTVAVMGYIGGNTPHVWSVDEWLRFSHLTQFPIWVGYNEDDPAVHAADAVTFMREHGWTPGGDQRRACILDWETEVDPSWANAFAPVLWDAGYETFMYGSESTIVDNPMQEGRWIALYDGKPDIPGDQGAIGHQYRANVPWEGTSVDLSVVTDTMLAHGGTGPRK